MQNVGYPSGRTLCTAAHGVEMGPRTYRMAVARNGGFGSRAAGIQSGNFRARITAWKRGSSRRGSNQDSAAPRKSFRLGF
jgi:hypothetical protein